MGRIPTQYSVDLAKYTLLELYLGDQEFEQLFTVIIEKHKAFLSGLATLPQFVSQSDCSFSTYIDKTLEEAFPGAREHLELIERIGQLEREAPDGNFTAILLGYLPADYAEDFKKLLKEIGSLARKFGLDYPWAVPLLLITAISRMFIRKKTNNVPNGLVDKYRHLLMQATSQSLVQSMQQWEPLRIEIPAAIVAWLPANKILEIVRTRLRDYREGLKKYVSLDTQDRFHTQIRWVFAKKRYNLSAKQIMDSEFLGEELVGYEHIAGTIRSWERKLMK